jgi:hypothetical protein
MLDCITLQRKTSGRIANSAELLASRSHRSGKWCPTKGLRR